MRALVLLFGVFFCFTINANNIKVGFIDTNQVLTNISQYNSSIEKISIEFEPKKQELLNLFNHIELVRSNINEITISNSGESIDAELAKLSNLEQSFKRETEFWQNTMNNKKIELIKEIELLINKTINDYAIKENYDLILYENVAFVSDKVDITQEIIKEIEKN